MSLLQMLINKKPKENSLSIETVQKTSLESTGKTDPCLNFPTQKESNNIQKFQSCHIWGWILEVFYKARSPVNS